LPAAIIFLPGSLIRPGTTTRISRGPAARIRITPTSGTVAAASMMLVATAVVILAIVLVSIAVNTSPIAIRAAFIAPAGIIASAVVVGVSRVMTGKGFIHAVDTDGAGDAGFTVSWACSHTGGQRKGCQPGNEKENFRVFHGGVGGVGLSF
jgi:hypothetical protein